MAKMQNGHIMATNMAMLPGYDTVTSHTWGMEKDGAGSRTGGTFLTWGLQNIVCPFPFQRVVSQKCW